MCLLPILMACMFSGCTNKENEFQPTPYQIQVPKYFPTQLNIPQDNPLTVEGIELGRYLFYDGRLSGRTHPDSLMSCGTCHIQQNAFECGINHPKYTGGRPHGLTGISTPHVMLPLFNLVWNENGYFWSGLISTSSPKGRQTLEDVVAMAVLAPHEIHGDTALTVRLIQSIQGYPALFEKAFGSPVITFRNISKAIAQFVRTITSSDSKFDRYMRGEEQLSESELAGYVLFMTENGADCFHCHGGAGNPLFTTNLFYNNGKDTVFTDTRDRYSVTREASDIGAYKAPSLRNVELTAPYMHDGRYNTLEEVVEFYSHHILWSPYVHPLMHHVSTGGIQLSPSQKKDLIAFIRTLRDETFLNNPFYSKPGQLPDGSKPQ